MSDGTGPQAAGDSAADRLMEQVDYRLRGQSRLAPFEVAAVLHALADHTAITAALRYSHPNPEGAVDAGRAASVGRWHAVADRLESGPTPRPPHDAEMAAARDADRVARRVEGGAA